MKIGKFIGRNEDIERFREALNSLLAPSSAKQPHFAFVYDAAENKEDKGGIGKTILLKEFLRIAATEFGERFLVVDEIFDFLEPVNSDRLSRICRLVRLLDSKVDRHFFDNFWKNIRGYYSRNVSIEKVLQEYYTGYVRLCTEVDKKILRFYDTFEVVEKTVNYYQEPYRFVEGQVADNSFVVISGRNKPDFTTPIWKGRESQIVEFPLKGFSDREAIEYFTESGHKNLDRQHIVALNKKAKGRPILLALIGDYLEGVLRVETILDLDEKNFKKNLVAFVHEFKDPPIEELILAMAHLKHWCNAEFLKGVVERKEQFDHDLTRLRSLSFVREQGENVVLHDEMQKMIQDYVLDTEHADRSLQRHISELAIDFYRDKIKSLRQKEKEFANDVPNLQFTRDQRFSLEAEEWYHRLYLDWDEDCLNLYFFEHFDPSLEEGHLDYCFILQGYLEELIKLLDVPVYDRNRIKFREARLNIEKLSITANPFYYNQAKTILDDLIKKAKQKQEVVFQGTLLIDYGALQFYALNLLDAEKNLRQSVRLLEGLDNDENKNILHDLYYFLGRSKNWLGYVLYNQGKFRESTKILEEAEKHLFTADSLVEEKIKNEKLKKLRRKQIDDWIAQIRGNLCRVYREIGNTRKSIYCGESSLKRRERSGNVKAIIRGLNSLGLIYMRNGDIYKAQELFDRAEKDLQNVFDPILLGRVRTNQATLLFKRDQYSDLLTKHTKKTLSTAVQMLGVDQEKINQAEEILNGVIDSLRSFNYRELATAHYNLGELNLMENKYGLAIKNFERSIKVAQLGEDAYTLLNAAQRQVLASYLKDDEALFHRYCEEFFQEKKQLEEPEETARYVVRYYITYGNFYYDMLYNGKGAGAFDENFIKAIEAYSDAISYAKSYAENSVRIAREVFEDRILEILKQSDAPDKLHNILLNEWKRRNLDPEELQYYIDFL